MAKVKVTTYSEVPEGELKKVEVQNELIALFKVSGVIYATSDVCTHEGCFLDQNNEVRGDVVECTCHGSQFDIKSGNVLLSPAIEPLRSYKVTVEGEEVFVDV